MRDKDFTQGYLAARVQTLENEIADLKADLGRIKRLLAKPIAEPFEL